MTELKLCKDCKWYKKDWIAHLLGKGHLYDRCMVSPRMFCCEEINLVSGKFQKLKYCYQNRGYTQYSMVCGPNGDYWEARK